MISAWHLLWIVPVSASAGILVYSLVTLANYFSSEEAAAFNEVDK